MGVVLEEENSRRERRGAWANTERKDSISVKHTS